MSQCWIAANSIEQIITHPPLAVFEVLSPEDRLQRMKRKLEDYRAMGIPEIWVIDPQDSTFYRYEDLQLLRNDTFSHSGKGNHFRHESAQAVARLEPPIDSSNHGFPYQSARHAGKTGGH